ncbi:glycosyltransferase family 2 protein [Providencia alcalifaciens]|uniref:Glycosyltransferase family 2 protein n=1 Tax=Providencia huashanensis TaxID=3037798 RepID=A0ABT9AP80_9GAMM|nr:MULTISPECIES: glycosyltransferase family 2 protein [unclassified Providencia]MDO7830240.1 glycosyltransferase family 2 protein [Providencia sp. CRE-138-0026]MDO7856410.1 glycosyltransferase family 2 protein [Providencia sp. CRE-138-0111]
MHTISVVIPYYNDSLVFSKTLKSISSQTTLPNEIVIIDDCSCDSSELEEMIIEFKKNNLIDIQYIRNIKNMNGAYSRNLGIEVANGEYVFLLDADDLWLPNHIELSLTFIVNNNLDYMYSNVIERSENKKDYYREVCDHLLLENSNDILFKSTPQTSSFVLKAKSILHEKIKFNETLQRHQDYQFFLALINSNLKGKHLNIYTSIYNMNESLWIKKIDYYSVFYFWNLYYDKFTPRNVKKKIIYFIIIAYYDQRITRNELINLISSFPCTSKIYNHWAIKILFKCNKKSKLTKKIFLFLFSYII